MVNKHTADYRPSHSQLTSRIHPLIFLWTSEGFIFPEKYFEFFLKPVRPTMFSEKFQVYGVKITSKYIYELKNSILFIFTNAPKQNSPLGSY